MPLSSVAEDGPELPFVTGHAAVPVTGTAELHLWCRCGHRSRQTNTAITPTETAVGHNNDCSR